MQATSPDLNMQHPGTVNMGTTVAPCKA